MNAKALLDKHRKRLFPAAVALALLLGLALFHEPIIAWFSGEPMQTGGGGAGVSAQAGPFALQAQLQPDPPRQEGNALVLQIEDADGTPVEDADVTVTYVMPAMGAMAEMRGETEVSERGDGRYRAAFDLPMGGSWSLETKVAKGDRSGEASFNMTVGRARASARRL